MLLVIHTNTCLSQQPLPLNPGNWHVEDKDMQSRPLDISTLYGRECMHLPPGQVAYYKDSSLMNFRMEMDIAGIAMPGFGFRGRDKQNYEYIYLRVLSDNQEDALQYLPVFNGGLSWQLYNYPVYEKKVSFPKKYVVSVAGNINDQDPQEEMIEELKRTLRSGGIQQSESVYINQTGPGLWKSIDPVNLSLHYLDQAADSMRIYNGLEWIHVKLKVKGCEALFYVEDMDTPVMEIENLKQEQAPGLLSFRNIMVDSYFANISIEKLENLADESEPEPLRPLPDFLSSWELSGKFSRDDKHLKEQIDSVMSNSDGWKQIHAQEDGLINLSKYFDVTEGTAILKTNIESRVDRPVKLLFDYSESLTVMLNSKIVFSDSLRIRDNEGRVMDGEEEIALDLVRGTNELLFILTSDAYRQNWGMVARIPGHSRP